MGIRAALMLVVVSLLAGSGPAGAQSKMTIATGVDPSFAPYYVGREGGFFARNGLDVTVNTGPSGSAMVAFLIGNQIQSAYGAEQAGVSAHLVDPAVVAWRRARRCSAGSACSGAAWRAWRR